jgi:transcriptional regulator with XRE-family HTH domain
MNGADSTPIQLARHLGRLTRAARDRLGLTQEEVAERVGIVTEVYGRLERGLMLPSMRTLRKICRVLGLDANAALGLGEGDARLELEGARPAGIEPPRLRRLVRMLRELDAAQLEVLRRVSRALLRPAVEKRPEQHNQAHRRGR